jgi:xanthine dehydrogenase small subunit
MRDYLRFFVNGQECRVRGAEAFQPLSTFLRNKLGITGTKIVCEEGDCGACTVLSGRLKQGSLDYSAINSCIQYVYQADLSHIITVEGLKCHGALNPVQEAMVSWQGAQCGFCTPGFVVALSGHFDKNRQCTVQGVRDCLTGNLCRCTGYEPIIKSAMNVDFSALWPLSKLYPPEKMVTAFVEGGKQSALVSSPTQSVFIPSTIEEAIKYKSDNPGAVIIAGGTDVSVNMNKRGFEPQQLLSFANLSDLDLVSVTDGMMTVGAKVTMAQLEDYFRMRVPEFHNILWVFGSPQIRNAATLAGNIANASPIGDTPPFLMVMDAVLELTGSRGTRPVRINEFYRGYKKFDLQSDEFISAVVIPLPAAHEIVKLYKVSRRKHLDIATSTAAFRLTLKKDIIEEIAVAYGGVAPVILRLPRTEAYLKGRPLSLETMTAAGEVAVSEISPIDDVRGSKAFRNQLARNLMLKLYYDIQEGRVPVCQP